ncbi:DNA-3-methyladenine glycosylase [Cryptosporangium phraense]|uniref:Putative 3-methyladenine DNA glycosylase n=1 Tax=Cryptosporangium phraense TaxID=2593070 RepID=A0A545AK14_9ACTN|nr:DNA-3-methyladenine glycosylase [Cryptosporangium phraense]TQS41664.1 DNA-3-methyladenine glycosylase [Cryptosporangium phraense]
MSLADVLAGPPEDAAPALLGRYVAAHGVTLRITETEAYAGTAGDPASHAYRRRTARNASMFEDPGTLYVYFSYGMHWCVNITCGPVGVAAAVLLRAGEVVDGVEDARRGRALRDRDLARGPARLTRALDLDRSADGTNLLDGRGPLVLLDRVDPVEHISAGPRTGVSQGADIPWRFWITGDPTVSPYRRSPRAALVGNDALRE